MTILRLRALLIQKDVKHSLQNLLAVIRLRALLIQKDVKRKGRGQGGGSV